MDVLEINQIMRLIPHRYPFLLVDKIIELIPGKSAVGIKNVTIGEPYFLGHFPNFPIFPGVLIVEALAQVGGVLLYKTFEAKGEKKEEDQYLLFAGIDEVRFKRPVFPGDTLYLHLELLSAKKILSKMRGVAKVEGREVASALLLASVKRKGEVLR